MRFDESGLTCAVGTGKGVVALYDLRSSKPMLVKDHMYSSPIVDLKFKEADGGSGGPMRPLNNTATGFDARLCWFYVHHCCRLGVAIE